MIRRGYICSRNAVVSIVSILILASMLPNANSQEPSPQFYQTVQNKIPNFAYNPSITSRQSGSWSSPSTWTQGKAPTTNDVVLVSAGHEVVYDYSSDMGIAAIGVEGKLSFRTDVSTRLKVGTMIVAPMGRLEIGTEESPVSKGVSAEIIIANRPLYTSSADPATGVKDPEQFGTGLIVLGEIIAYGESKNPTWTRLAKEPLAGDIILFLKEKVVNWRVGDRLLLPDTRHLPIDVNQHFDNYKFTSQSETFTISSISPDGAQVTISTPLKYSHAGARDPDGTPTRSFNGDILLPHVANLARNIMIRSESPAGTRGHVMHTHMAMVDIHNVGYYDLGRTTVNDLDSTDLDSSGKPIHIGVNQIARYPAHFHHLMGTARPTMPKSLSPEQIRSWLESNGWQYEFTGNVIASSDDATRLFKWGIVIHASHFGKVEGNVVYNVAGSGLTTEDASESYNLISKNFAVKINGEGHVRLAKPSEPPDIAFDIGRDGSGFWYRGPQNWMEGNVAADSTFSNHYLNSYYMKDIKIPLFPGADPSKPEEGTSTTLRKLLSFSGNEGYGTAQIGLYGAWVLACCNAGNWPEIKINNFVAWHDYQQTIWWYHNGRTTFNNIILRGDPKVTSKPSFNGLDMHTIGFDLTAYENVDITISNADIRGMIVGIDMPRKMYEFSPFSGAPTLVTDSRLQNYVNVRVSPAHAGPPPRIMIVANSLFEPFSRGATNENPSQLDVEMTEATTDKDKIIMAGENLEVKNFNNINSDNFRVYYAARPGNPCTTKRERVSGYACPTSPSIDTAPPSLSNGKPAGKLPAGTTQAALSLDTNEIANCRYSTTPGVQYSSMTGVFTTTGGTGHSTPITGLADGQNYVFYARCRDSGNNANAADFLITFSVDSAQLQLCPWDLFGPEAGGPDGKVNLGDILFLLKDLGKTAGDSGYNPKEDLNGNSKIDLGDALMIVSHFGDCPV